MLRNVFGCLPGRWLARAVMVCALWSTGAVVGSATAEPRTLRIGTLQPDGSPQHKSVLDFKQRVEAASGGTLRIDIHTGNKLYKTPDAVATLKARGVEIAAVLLDDLVRDLPAVDVFVQPFLFYNEDILRTAWRRGSPVRRPIDAAIQRTIGLRTLWWHHNGVGVVLSNGLRATLPDDIAGKRVRVPGPTLGKWIDACGGTAVPVSIQDTADALRTRKVDMVLTQLTAISSRKMHEWSDTVTLTRHYIGGIVFAMTNEAWASLMPVQQKAIEEAGIARDTASIEEGLATEVSDIAAAKARGMTVHQTEPHEVGLWRACASPVLEQYVANAGALGEEIMAGYRAILIDRYRGPSN